MSRASRTSWPLKDGVREETVDRACNDELLYLRASQLHSAVQEIVPTVQEAKSNAYAFAGEILERELQVAKREMQKASDAVQAHSSLITCILVDTIEGSKKVSSVLPSRVCPCGYQQPVSVPSRGHV